jgi:hypothetical protein
MTTATQSRAHMRRPMRMKASVLHQRVGWERDATVTDLGLGGAGIEIAESLMQGDRITFSLVAPNLWDPLLIAGRIVWVKPGTGLDPIHCGIAFEFTHAATLWALFDLLGTLDYEL